MKKIMALVISSAIVLGGKGAAGAKGDYNVNRISGKNRYETSINIAKHYNNEKFENVIIANGNDFPDALAGSALSKKLKAPILLIDGSINSSRETINLIKSKLVKNGSIYILGGEGAVSRVYEDYFKDLGYKNIKRLGGINRFATNKSIVKTLNVEKGTPIVIVNGFGFADALSVSSSAASKGYPIFMSNADKLSNEIKDIIKDISPTKAFMIGGEGVMRNSIVDELKNIVPSLNKDNIERVAGKNRYETSLNVCSKFNLLSDNAIVANGENFPDALSGSALASKMDAPIILTDGVNISKQKEYLDNNSYKNIILLGGTGVINTESQRILENKPVISDKDAKNLLFNGDEEFKKMLKIEVHGESYIDLAGISYAPVRDDLSEYNSIYDYLNKNFKLNTHYTENFIKNMISFAFKNIDGQCYMRYGNPEPRLIVKDAKIIEKKYDGNKVYVSLKGYYPIPGHVSNAKATLIYDGTKWVIDEFDNWFEVQ
ncbi:cell wall-binding repeat-containing protein [Clostridium botulinum]|uniref:cell wall-binding repeat-containing protein n=1 Tax=Clostridium botulinum TaxID=1491 RepID=UPI000585F62E|nr:cell wall-binding repeat-containing protein [Clostridium botulinum]AJD27023.1 cell wall binding repeat 2 family protein [Clostridium botulinum CDC_297]MBY6757677.1 cell wall-binding repeat-containing protein [Clostridium botulinum]MBY6877167.1 cell wall-binding repeat-containing protein [Clostridium botulinum]MBY6892597.1 cell wall-binding repeat-containing protein [Clostridium botulinum]MBY6896332.1 cell wall-binding repeat-containing protein [Clostridium botulinum]